MRHLGIIGTVAFFPYALYCLDRALLSFKNNMPAPLNLKARTLLWLMFFALCFGMQALAGFPQTTYICGLFYGVLILWRLIGILHIRPLKALYATLTTLVLILGIATLLGALMGMTSLLPLWELGTLSDRAGGLTFEDVNPFPYPPKYLLSFFCPYYYGDVSNVTFEFLKEALFWEVYGYAGMLTPLLAFIAIGMALVRVVKEKRGFEPRQTMTSQILFWSFVGILALCMVLSPIIPLYEIAFHTIPGFSSFRFPTRFLFVTVLSLCLLGGIGFTWLQAKLSDLLPPTAVTRNRLFIGLLLILFTMADLVYHNQRQNPMIDSQSWLTATESTKIIQQNPGRSYSPDATWNHQKMFFFAKGWASDLTPYFIHRNLLQPNSNLLQGVPSLTAYAGISPRWVVDLVGDHNRFGLLIELRAEQKLKAYYQWLQALSVKWVILTFPAKPTEQLFLVDKGKTSLVSYLYELQMPLPRARFAKQLQCLATIQDVKRESVAGRLDPTQTTLLHSPQELTTIQTTLESWKQKTSEPSISEDSVTFIRDRATEITLKASSKEGALLVLADTYYPGWEASINGENAQIYRVNMMNRGVLVPPGAHTVSFHYRPWTVRWGIIFSLIETLSILILFCYYSRKTKEALV
jgi:hypothetical protein